VVDLGGILIAPSGNEGAISALLQSLLAPRARGDKSDACVPIHPPAVVLQTLHGLVNKQHPANLANAIEILGWLGGSPAQGAVAGSFLNSFAADSDAKDGLTGFLESVLPVVANGVWNSLPARFQSSGEPWPTWVQPSAIVAPATSASSFASFPRTPFRWFWHKWSTLCDPANRWNQLLPARRFVDWALCLLRTGLAFSYLWEAEFFLRFHDYVANRSRGDGAQINVLQNLLSEGAVLASIEPTTVPPNQKAMWPATSELIARGYEARKRLLAESDDEPFEPSEQGVVEIVDEWISTRTANQMELLARPLETNSRTANNQKEFVRYLLLPRSSDDDLVDQADFYFLARTNSRHMWFHPGPEWIVVVASLLCKQPGGRCTLGMLSEDLASLGVRVERSVLVGLLEEAGLSADSPDADSALVIRSGF